MQSTGLPGGLVGPEHRQLRQNSSCSLSDAEKNPFAQSPRGAGGSVSKPRLGGCKGLTRPRGQHGEEWRFFIFLINVFTDVQHT